MRTPQSQARWDQHNVTDLIRDILRTLPPDLVRGIGRPFMTAYQLAIELTNRHPAVAAVLVRSAGGEGNGPYALTTYIARWLPDRIRRGATDIEFRVLSSRHMLELVFDHSGNRMIATTHQAGWETTMFRLVD